MQELLHNDTIIYTVIAFVIFGLTQGIKWACVKPFTRKIRDERTRKAINTVIYLIPFGLGMLFEYLYGVMLNGGTFSAVQGIINGSSGVALFGAWDRAYSVISGSRSNNPYENTEEGKAVKDLMDAVVEDSKIDKNDKDAIKNFWEKVK